MPGALNSLSTPPTPNPGPAPALMGAPGMPPGMPQAPQGPGAAPPQAPPAPTHQQTVSALRHFAAIGKQLEIALKDPDLGKSSIKDKLIDGATTLVADRIIPPGQAVTMLATFPERPYDQKVWIIQHYQQIQQAENAVLAHHAAAFAGQGPQPTPNQDSHLQDMAGLMSGHYSGQNGR